MATAHAQPKDTLQVYFPLDKAQLTDEAGKYLDSLINHNVLEHGKHITLLGFGDYLGSDDYNYNLSYNRAKNVEDYLVLAGFDKRHIMRVTGKGRISRAPVYGKKGYLPDRKVEIIIDSKIDTPAEEKCSYYILRLQDDETYPLREIRFYRGSLRITPESLPALKMLYRFLARNSNLRIQLEGHVCCLGPFEGVDEPYDESTLSQKRAETIADSMFVYGIEKSRIKCIGLGNNNLIRDPETGEENMELSRRVEIRILGR